MIYFAVIANSKACVDGLQAQKECQEVNQHVQRQLTQAQELLNEKKAEAATCKQAVVTLRDSLKKEQARVEELQGELATLNQQLQDLSEKLRRKSEASAEDYPSRFSVLFFPAFLAGVVMTAGHNQDWADSSSDSRFEASGPGQSRHDHMATRCREDGIA
nr:PREDICTED: bone marrow stromal antigen 2 [Bos mutus]